MPQRVGTQRASSEEKQGFEDGHLNPGGEDGLVVEDGVADAAEVEVVVLDARSHTEPGLEAARSGLQQGRLGEEKCWREGGQGRNFGEENQTESCFIYLQKCPNQGGRGGVEEEAIYLEEWDFTYHPSFQN